MKPKPLKLSLLKHKLNVNELHFSAQDAWEREREKWTSEYLFWSLRFLNPRQDPKISLIPQTNDPYCLDST